MSLRANGTSSKCILVARVPHSYQLLPAIYTMLTSAYFDDSLATYWYSWEYFSRDDVNGTR